MNEDDLIKILRQVCRTKEELVRLLVLIGKFLDNVG